MGNPVYKIYKSGIKSRVYDHYTMFFARVNEKCEKG